MGNKGGYVIKNISIYSFLLVPVNQSTQPNSPAFSMTQKKAAFEMC